MKTIFSGTEFSDKSVLITCSSHEERCEALARKMGSWHPGKVVLFHYVDDNPLREQRHKTVKQFYGQQSQGVVELAFATADPVGSFRENSRMLGDVMAGAGSHSVVVDVTVFTRCHLLMLLQWLDDHGRWDDCSFIYTEPEDYDVSKFIPLSFGIRSLEEVPGFSATPDMSRALHLVLFLGYEGDRALAVFERIQPVETTLIIPSPAFHPGWEGRTEEFNADLIKMVGSQSLRKVNPIDPVDSVAALTKCCGSQQGGRTVQSHMICPLGPKPQLIGMYSFVRHCDDPPAVIHAGALRHNHFFYSHGIGRTWVIRA